MLLSVDTLYATGFLTLPFASRDNYTSIMSIPDLDFREEYIRDIYGVAMCDPSERRCELWQQG